MSDEARRRRAKARAAVRKAKQNRDEARQKLLDQRRKLAARRQRNRERMRENAAANEGSHNPTAHSTVPDGDSNAEASARSQFSTVPARPRHSSVPPQDRLYGLSLRERAEGEE